MSICRYKYMFMYKRKMQVFQIISFFHQFFWTNCLGWIVVWMVLDKLSQTDCVSGKLSLGWIITWKNCPERIVLGWTVPDELSLDELSSHHHFIQFDSIIQIFRYPDHLKPRLVQIIKALLYNIYISKRLLCSFDVREPFLIMSGWISIFSWTDKFVLCDRDQFLTLDCCCIEFRAIDLNAYV